mmetsp:Transcript_19129/g.27790  ORF Transcript_19129/g.27790 Transcript_19129/m.27790 type:complete len:100 (+) Transcript_19129:562-861(+)
MNLWRIFLRNMHPSETKEGCINIMTKKIKNLLIGFVCLSCQKHLPFHEEEKDAKVKSPSFEILTTKKRHCTRWKTIRKMSIGMEEQHKLGSNNSSIHML